MTDGAAHLDEKPIGVLVLGLGNVLLGDDGLGAAAIARLERGFCIPPGVQLADGGTLGLALLGLLGEARHLVIVDAVRADAPPGSPVRLAGEDVIDAVRNRLSPHQVGVADLLDAARLTDCYPSSVTLLGLVPEMIALGVARSRAVEAGLAGLVEAVVGEVERLGYAMVHIAESAGGNPAARPLARHFGM